MSDITQNLKLFKYNTLTDGKEVFSIDKAINENLDKIDASTLNHSLTTNCLTEIPQRIKLEKVGSTITLKTGSVVIVPYGTTDQTKQFPVDSNFKNKFKVVHTQFSSNRFFLWLELVQDLTRTAFGTYTGDNVLLALNINNGNIDYAPLLNVGTGTTPPETGNYYNTSINKFCYYSDAQISAERTLPIALVSMNAGTATQIKQIFNGFGVVGNIAWCDKDVKALIPNGWTGKGTYNNIELCTSLLSMVTITNKSRPNTVFLESSGKISVWGKNTGNVDEYEYLPHTPYKNNIKAYVHKENFWWYASDKGVWTQKIFVTPIMTVTTDATPAVTNVQCKQVLNVMDNYSHREDLQNTAVVIETYNKGFSGYRLWSDNYCEQWGYIGNAKGTTTVSLLKNYNNSFYNVSVTGGTDRTGNYYDVKVYHNFIRPSSFIVYLSQGASPRYTTYWKTSGYIR